MEKENNNVIIIFSSGKHHTQIYADGRIYADGIRSIDFHKEGCNFPELSASAGVLPISGDGDVKSLEWFLKNISDEIQKYIPKGEDATATARCDSSTEIKE